MATGGHQQHREAVTGKGSSAARPVDPRSVPEPVLQRGSQRQGNLAMDLRPILRNTLIRVVARRRKGVPVEGQVVVVVESVRCQHEIPHKSRTFIVARTAQCE